MLIMYKFTKEGLLMNDLIARCHNIVFDVGNVLLRFDPASVLHQALTPEQQAILTPEIFCGSPHWDKLDEGTLTEEEVADIIAETVHCSAWRKDILRVIQHYQDYMPVLPTVNILPVLKRQGKKLFVLSNYGPAPFERARQKHPEIFDLFDGLVISGIERINKPDPRLYRILLERYHLDAADSVFIDDRDVNIEAARQLGINGIIFTGQDLLA